MTDKIIKTFELGGIVWDVVEQDRTDILGQCELSRARIIINSKCIDKLKAPTYYHELTHAILYTMGHDLYNNEEFVDTFSAFLYQSIKTNKKLGDKK